MKPINLPPATSKKDVCLLQDHSPDIEAIIPHRGVFQARSESASDGWFTARLGDIIELKCGYNLPKQNRCAGHVPVISSAGESGYHSESRACAPGVVTGRYGTLGKVFFVKRDFWPLNTTLYVADFKGNDPRFIGYLLQQIDVSMYSDKAAVPGINRHHLHESIVRLPRDVNEQRGISTVLNNIEEKIESNNKQSDMLERIARGIFRSWFIDFDPVHANIRNQDFGLPLSVQDLFPGRLVQSPMGLIPQKWTITPVGECFMLTMGQSPPSSSYIEEDEGLPFFQGRSDFGFRFPRKRRYCTDPLRIAHSGDTLVSVRAPVGDLNLAMEECCIGRGIAALRHLSGSASFTYYAVGSIQDQIARYEDTGTVFGCINRKQFESLWLIEPTYQLIDLFDDFVSPIDLKIRSMTVESHTLTALHEALVPKLMSGQLRYH